MSAGLPGVGLTGIFFILSALVAVPLELLRMLQGRSSLARWGAVLRHFALALAMLAGLELFYAMVHLALAQLPPSITEFSIHPRRPAAPTSSGPDGALCFTRVQRQQDRANRHKNVELGIDWDHIVQRPLS